MTTVWCRSVLLFISQIPHPLAPILEVGTPYLKYLNSPLIEAIFESGVVLFAHWTFNPPYHVIFQSVIALSAEQVPTSRL